MGINCQLLHVEGMDLINSKFMSSTKNPCYPLKRCHNSPKYENKFEKLRLFPCLTYYVDLFCQGLPDFEIIKEAIKFSINFDHSRCWEGLGALIRTTKYSIVIYGEKSKNEEYETWAWTIEFGYRRKYRFPTIKFSVN